MSRHSHAFTVACVLGVGGLAAGVSPALGAFPGENGRIVFDSARHGGDIDVWTMRADGSDPLPLTDNSHAFDGVANWRADGRKIAFMSDRETPSNPATPPDFDPDFEIFVMNADGSNQMQITFNELDDEEPAWSADGERIVFQRDFVPAEGEVDYELFTIKADGSRETRLTNSPGVSEVEPNWSPDGRRIAFVSDRDLDDNDEIYTMRPDGSGVRRLTFNKNAFDGRPNWSPDGRMIAFQSATGDDSPDIFTMPADGGDRTLLASSDGFDGHPAWAPDGRQIAFASDRGGDPEVFTMRADGNDPVNLTQNHKFDAAPDWQPLQRRP
jgi:TolB protein